MITIQRFVVNMIEENCYVISDETREALIIDNGAITDKEHSAIEKYISQNGLTLKHAIFTHAHFDHILGSGRCYRAFGLKSEFNDNDAELYNHLSLQVESFLGPLPYSIETAPQGNSLSEGDIISFGNHKFVVIETPGHTPGGVCFYCKQENVLFSGDSLFQYSIGRTDFPESNTQDLLYNLRTKILTLPENTVVYPGHGGQTTIGQEKRYNPFLH